MSPIRTRAWCARKGSRGCRATTPSSRSTLDRPSLPPRSRPSHRTSGTYEEDGLFVTDAVDPWSPALYRSAVTTLNPHGADISRGMKNGDSLDLSTTYPAYDGIVVRVVDRITASARAGDGRATAAIVDPA